MKGDERSSDKTFQHPLTRRQLAVRLPLFISAFLWPLSLLAARTRSLNLSARVRLFAELPHLHDFVIRVAVELFASEDQSASSETTGPRRDELEQRQPVSHAVRTVLCAPPANDRLSFDCALGH